MIVSSHTSVLSGQHIPTVLLLISRKVLGRTGFVESNIPHFIFVLSLIYYMAFGRSYASLYLSFHLKMSYSVYFYVSGRMSGRH